MNRHFPTKKSISLKNFQPALDLDHLVTWAQANDKHFKFGQMLSHTSSNKEQAILAEWRI